MESATGDRHWVSRLSRQLMFCIFKPVFIGCRVRCAGDMIASEYWNIFLPQRNDSVCPGEYKTICSRPSGPGCRSPAAGYRGCVFPAVLVTPTFDACADVSSTANTNAFLCPPHTMDSINCTLGDTDINRCTHPDI